MTPEIAKADLAGAVSGAAAGPRPRAPSPALIFACVAVTLLLAMVVAAWRLTEGPVATTVFTPAIERLLALQAPGGHARVARAEIVWSATAKTLGLSLHDVSLSDSAGRPVLTARRMEFGWAADSLMVLRPSLGRVSAEDFFAALSVSPQGRYALGYSAEGAPGRPTDLTALFGDLTGRTRWNHPVSYLREIELSSGVVDLRQVGAPLAWRGHVQRLHFRKADGRLEAAVDLSVGEGPRAAVLKARGTGALGLGQATAQAWVTDLDPAHVFPSVGATRDLSALDAPVQGQAALAYAARTGVQGADIRLTAGEGHARFGAAFEPFHAAELRAVFDPRSGAIALPRVFVSSARADFDLNGSARLNPESSRNDPASLSIWLRGQSGALLLADHGDKQRIGVMSAQARLIPARGRIEIASARAQLGQAVADAHGVLARGKAGQSYRIDLDGRLNGAVRLDQFLALWPDRLSRDARQWVAEHVTAGRVGDIGYSLRLPAGVISEKRALENRSLDVNFSVSGGEVLIRKDMPTIQGAEARGHLQGDRFQMDLSRAAMNGIALSRGEISLPQLKGPERKYIARFQAAGDLRKIVEIIDAPGDHVLSGQGMQPAKFSGAAQVDFSISRPIGPGYGDSFTNYDISYKGAVRNGGVAGVAMGVDLTSPLVSIEGTEDSLTGKGDVRLGPYRGPLDFASRFPIGKPVEKTLAFQGVLDMSKVGLGGPTGATMPFKARFDSRGDQGHAVVDSKGFVGKASWQQGPKGRILVEGKLEPSAWRALGLPVSRTMGQHTPARLDLQRIATGWSGALTAGAYSGSIGLTSGPIPRVRYVAELTPAESRQIGLTSPDFSHNQPLIIDVAAQRGSGAASYVVGPMKGQVNWASQADGRTQYHWRSTLAAADLHALGLPASVEPKGPLALDVAMTGLNGGWAGTAQMAGANLRFSAAGPAGGPRSLTFSGPVDASALDLLGLAPVGLITGPLGVAGQVTLDPRGPAQGHLDIDLARAAVTATTTGYRKPAGRALSLAADFARNPDGSLQASKIRIGGPGVSIDASASLRPDSASTLDARVLKVDGVYDGSLQITADERGRTVTAHGRFFDARTLIHDLSAPPTPAGAGGGGGGAHAQGLPVRLDLDISQVTVTDRVMLRNVRASGVWAEPGHRRLDVNAATPAGSAVSVHLTPDPGGGLISARLANFADAAHSLMAVDGFSGGTATLQGHLRPDGADLDVEIRNVRLVRASMLARILTMGSLRGMADTLNGEGIAFARVVAPVKLRGSQLVIGEAHATGSAIGLTAKGVVDIDRRTMDLSGAVAPAYGLNSMVGNVPVLGSLLVSKKGEGVFGLTYSARGPFAQPKISVNPFSLAAPGILRRMFEGRPAAQLDTPAPAAPVAANPD